jgi:putative transcriptional regulator
MRNYEGKLLVAHPKLTEGAFAYSVIYVYQDNASGTVGIVLNKPTSWKVKEFLASKNFDYLGSEVIYKGGPVNEQAIVLLHDNDWYSSNTMQIGSGLAISSDVLMLDKISTSNTPAQWRLFAGVAAWAPGQLVREMHSPVGWQVATPNDSIVFDRDGERQWNKAIQLCSQQLIDQYI